MYDVKSPVIQNVSSGDLWVVELYWHVSLYFSVFST